MILEQVKEVQRVLKVAYSKTRYETFIEKVLLSTEREGDRYQQREFIAFQELCESVAHFEAEQLQRIISLGEEK